MKQIQTVFGILFLASIAANGWFLFHPNPNKIASATYPLLANEVDSIPKSDRLINFVPLSLDLDQYTATQSATISAYFEYIPTGTKIGIQEKRSFLYASLLKTPLVMALYQEKNTHQVSLDDIVTITNEDIDKSYGSLWIKGAGSQFSLKDIMFYALTDSDNTAYNVLKRIVPKEKFAGVFDYLNIPLELEDDQMTVSPQNYTSIFRSLYYSSYLPPEDSNEILHTLSQSTFTSGITAYLPKNIPVAHKMGIREEKRQLSDCGIIYHPTRPYFLCIMMRAKEATPENFEPMRIISQKIYTFIDKQNE